MPISRFSPAVFTRLILILLGPLAAGASEFPNTWYMDDKPAVRAVHASLEGKPARSLNLAPWLNGKADLRALKGKVVVLDFFATWCGPCMRAIPHNNEMFEKYKDQGVEIIGVCTSSEGQEKMNQVVQLKGIKYPTGADPYLTAEHDWAVHYYPTYAVVDRKGIVRVVGLNPYRMENVIKKLLAETP
jgi:thiol-disulfide isomerase/thioredoxin